LRYRDNSGSPISVVESLGSFRRDGVSAIGTFLGSLAASHFPTAKLRTRLVSMVAEQNVAIIAVDRAYTSRWGAQHWQKPLTTPRRKPTRHDAASIAVGRRALGHPIRLGVPPRL